VSLIGWWKLDGNAYDSSPSRNNGDVTGVTYDPAYGKIGQGANFIGNGNSYIDFSEYTLTDHHSIAFWAYGNRENPGGGDASQLMGDKRPGADGLIMLVDNLRFGVVHTGGTDTWEMGDGNDTDYYHRWRHFVLLFESGELNLFVDGIAQPDNPNSYNASFVFNNIGASAVADSNDYEGNINDVRIYDHILSIKEIKALASAKVLHWQFSHERNTSGQLVLDSSGYGRDATLDANAPTWSSDTVAGVGCYDISANEYIEIDSTDFPVEFGDAITISCWAMWNSLAAHQVFVHGTVTGSITTSYVLVTSSNGTSMSWWINDGGGADFNHNMAIGTWYHIVATYDGSNLNVYINGVSKAGNAVKAGAITNQNGLKIGLDGIEAPYGFAGKMADVRIYNRGYDATDGLAFATALYQTSAQLDSGGNLWC